MRKKYKDAVRTENGRMNELSPVVAVLACYADESCVDHRGVDHVNGIL